MDYPRIYLAIDNCFAQKRWTEPLQWAKLIKDLGIDYIEASADNECDPLYHGAEYLQAWSDEVLTACKKYEVKIANLYSGHGTYATLGLYHTKEEIRDRFMNDWLKPMIKTASRLSAGLGFFIMLFPNQCCRTLTDILWLKIIYMTDFRNLLYMQMKITVHQ